MKRLWVMALAGLVAAALAACGDDGGGSDSSTDADSDGELVDRLSDDVPYLGTVDLAAVREQLDIDPDTELEVGNDLYEDEVQARYFALAVIGLPYLGVYADLPVTKAIDVGQVSEAASSNGDFEDLVAVIRTSQPFDEIAETLEDEGYEEDGDLLVYGDLDDSLGYPYVGADGDVVVLAQSEAAVEDALEGGDEPLDSPAATMLATVDGTARAAVVFEDDLECGQAFAVGVNAEPAEGVFVAFAGPDADVDDALPALEDEEEGEPPNDPRVGATGIDPTDAEVDGDYVRVTFDYDDPEVPIRTPLDLLRSDLLPGSLYDC